MDTRPPAIPNHIIWPVSRRAYKNQPIRNKNRLWRPRLLTDRDEMSNLYRGPSIDASYQVSVHLDKQFQGRRLKCEKLIDDKRRTPSDGKSSHCTQSLYRNPGLSCLWCYVYDVIMYILTFTWQVSRFNFTGFLLSCKNQIKCYVMHPYSMVV